ncbi:hypothetical protein PSPO01_14024 [Paraphaeosphaeria sporulosa]
MAMTTSSAPSLQVDLAGLSQLIFNVGSHGLKQLATAGVDIHSIGCMLMIAEYTPASQEFRKKINYARNAQRSERLWLYKFVEIGASTNFLADQLLKTRAGENVLALMAAITPVMDEETCTVALNALFEEAKVSLDNIPGLGQLRSLRTDLVPLSRRVGFGEKVFNYHKFLWSIHPDHSSTMPKEGPYSAIPLAKDIASIIRMLHKVVSTEEPYIFICWGFRGAAWITSYASEVLGLKVCALQADRTPIPVTGSYEDAKILIELSSNKSSCGLYLKKTLEEQFELSKERPENQRGWSVDCAIVHFLEYRLSKITQSESLPRISAFVAIETLNQVSTLASAISSWTENRMAFQNANMTGFVTYAESELRHIQARSLRILRQLGFLPGDIESYKFSVSKGCPTYICHGHMSDPPVLKVESDIEDTYYDYELKKTVIRTYDSLHGQYMVSGARFGLTITDRLRYYIADPIIYELGEVPPGSKSSFDHGFLKLRLDKQQEVSETIRIASHFASYLAFSDWDVTIRQMSVSFLQFGQKQERRDERECFEAHMSSAIPLCADNLDLSTLENKLWSADWLALDLDGLIVHRNTARNFSIHDLRGKFLGFTAGRIVSEGETCSKVRSDRVGLSYQDFASEVSGAKIAACVPRLKFRGLGVRTLLSTVKDTLFVRLEGFLDSKPILVGDASLVGQKLPDAFVSVPCKHGYHEPTTIQTLQDNAGTVPIDLVDVIEGLIFDTGNSRMYKTKLHLYYQLVDSSPLGQWLACHWTSENKRAFIIVQKDCCFGCIVQRTMRLYDIIEDSGYPLPAEGLDGEQLLIYGLTILAATSTQSAVYKIFRKSIETQSQWSALALT